jgi:hypothetical protein
LIHGIRLGLHSSCVLLVMLDTQAQFMLADFQQRLESPHPLRVHAINAMSCVAVTKVMLVTICLRGKAATLSTISVIRKADRPWENESPHMNAAIPERRPATEEISGLIERVTFHNDESGFCVLLVSRTWTSFICGNKI